MVNINYNILNDIKQVIIDNYKVRYVFHYKDNDKRNTIHLYRQDTYIPTDIIKRVKEIEHQIKLIIFESKNDTLFYNSLVNELNYYNKKYNFYHIEKIDLNLIKNKLDIYKIYDEYANGIYEINNIKCNLFFSHLDMAMTRNPLRIITLMVIYPNKIIEIGDVVYNILYNKLYIENHKLFKFPFDLNNISYSTFSWKDSFMFYPEKNELFIKCDSFTLNKIPIQYRIIDHIRLKIDPKFMRKIKLSNLNN